MTLFANTPSRKPEKSARQLAFVVVTNDQKLQCLRGLPYFKPVRHVSRNGTLIAKPSQYRVVTF